jgi:HlyD family secretion protein
VGQKVNISLDADPSRRLEGTVTSVANVGEQRPNQDSKVFEVKIEVAGADTTLRPGMTTSNAIETSLTDDVLSVPIEAVNGDSTAVSYVFRKSGRGVVKQEVETGPMNDNDIVILRGLGVDDRVMLTVPSNAASMTLERLPEGSKKAAPAPAATPPATPPADTTAAPVMPQLKPIG